MNDPLKNLEALAARARQEAAPTVAVSDGVRRALRERSAPEVQTRWLAWAAMAAAAAAGPAGALCLQSYRLWSDPLVSYLHDLSWVLL
jgi:hypothetical protein